MVFPLFFWLKPTRWHLLQFPVLASLKWNMNVKMLTKQAVSSSIQILLFPSIFYHVPPVLNSTYFFSNLPLLSLSKVFNLVFIKTDTPFCITSLIT